MTKEEFIGKAADAILALTPDDGTGRVPWNAEELVFLASQQAEAALEAVGAWELYQRQNPEPVVVEAKPHRFRPALDRASCARDGCGPGNPDGCHEIVDCMLPDPQAWCGLPQSAHAEGR